MTPHTTHVKICGITRREDAALASELGADYLGFIFVKESPRYIEPEHAAEIVAALVADRRSRLSAERRSGDGGHAGLPALHFVGVFRNQPIDEVRRIAQIAQIDLVQLHGDETYTLGELPTIKAFHVRDALPDADTRAEFVMFDTGGGTGRTFDWSLLASYPRSKPFFLAGGLTPANVAAAIAAARPFAIDVASGVESAPGVKDHHKLRELFSRIQR